MTAEGPVLETLTHRLSETPEDFLLDPDTISVQAIAQDHLRAMGIEFPGKYFEPGIAQE